MLLAVSGGSFYGGMIYSKSQNARTFNGANFQGIRNGVRMGGAIRAGFISGDIISKDSDSITLQLPNSAGSKIIFFSDSTEIMKSVNGATSDLEIGKTVTVNGSTNSDGSITAQSIQLRNQLQGPQLIK